MAKCGSSSSVDQVLYARLAGEGSPPPSHALTILAVSDLALAVSFYRAAFGWEIAVETPAYVELVHPNTQRNTQRPVAAVPEGDTASAEQDEAAILPTAGDHEAERERRNGS